MDCDTFMRVLEAARDEDGAFPFKAFLALFLEVRGRAQWATAAEMLDFVERDFSRLRNGIEDINSLNHQIT